jgi:hypothetical protein
LPYEQSQLPSRSNGKEPEHDNQRYIVDLLKRVTRDPLETYKIVASLPTLNES